VFINGINLFFIRLLFELITSLSFFFADKNTHKGAMGSCLVIFIPDEFNQGNNHCTAQEHFEILTKTPQFSTHFYTKRCGIHSYTQQYFQPNCSETL